MLQYAHLIVLQNPTERNTRDFFLNFCGLFLTKLWALSRNLRIKEYLTKLKATHGNCPTVNASQREDLLGATCYLCFNGHRTGQTRRAKGVCQLCRISSITISRNRQKRRLIEQLKLPVIDQKDLSWNTSDNRDPLLSSVISSVSQIVIFKVYQLVLTQPHKFQLTLLCQRPAKIYLKEISH